MSGQAEWGEGGGGTEGARRFIRLGGHGMRFREWWSAVGVKVDWKTSIWQVHR